MGDDCYGCREWEEHIYWSHFQSFRFFLILPSSYDQQVAIPQKFVNNLRDKLAGAISLRGPGGALWNVEVTAGGAGDTLFFKQGWKTFVEDHSLEENDVLIFKYTGDSRFDVLMFDKESLCEKEASYFVRRCTDVGRGCKRNSETFPEVTKESSHDATNGDDVPLKRHRSAAKTSKPVAQQPKAGSSKPATTPYRLELSSNRRPVTIQEKEKALQMAHAASSEDSFIVIMQPSHVYKSFYMSIPFEWLRKYLPQKSRNLILRCNESEWSVTFQRRFHNNGGLTVGWRKFVLDNCLEESDVCLFKPAGKTAEAMVFKVSIFRVVEDQVIPPCPANPVIPSKGRARSLAVYFSNHRAKMN